MLIEYSAWNGAGLPGWRQGARERSPGVGQKEQGSEWSGVMVLDLLGGEQGLPLVALDLLEEGRGWIEENFFCCQFQEFLLYPWIVEEDSLVIHFSGC